MRGPGAPSRGTEAMVRQHVNPLSSFHQLPRCLPPPAELFTAAELPLHLDIGCARGRFLLALARQEPGRNHLGVEIRRPLVEAAEADRQAEGLPNLRYLFCNATINLQLWLGALPAGWLARLRPGWRLKLTDARGSRRVLRVVAVSDRGCWAEANQTLYVVPGTVPRHRRAFARGAERRGGRPGGRGAR